MRKPLAIALGDQDFVMDVQTLEKVKEILGKSKTEYETRVYAGAGHGFAVRADPKNMKVMEQSVEAEDQAIAWFQRQFAKVGSTL